MNWSAECAAIIPCLNEAGTIGPLIRQVQCHLPRVYVVDDGSTDDTSRLALAAGAKLIQHSRPLGKGAALQSGLAQALADGFSWAITLDGDGQHLPSEIPAFFHAVNPGVHLVVGNRMAQPEHMPLIRRFVNRWMSRRISNLAGLPLPDSQCGFRLIHLQAWSSLRFDCSHFDFESEMLLKFIKARCAVAFVRVRTIYNLEHSKIRPVRDSLRWLKWWLRVRWAPVSLPALATPLSDPLPERVS